MLPVLRVEVEVGEGDRQQEIWVMDGCSERVGWDEGFRAGSLLMSVYCCDYLWWLVTYSSSCGAPALRSTGWAGSQSHITSALKARCVWNHATASGTGGDCVGFHSALLRSFVQPHCSGIALLFSLYSISRGAGVCVSARVCVHASKSASKQSEAGGSAVVTCNTVTVQPPFSLKWLSGETL